MSGLLLLGVGTYQRLMVVGGYPNEYEVEVIDLSAGHQHCTGLQAGTKTPRLIAPAGY